MPAPHAPVAKHARDDRARSLELCSERNTDGDGDVASHHGMRAEQPRMRLRDVTASCAATAWTAILAEQLGEDRTRIEPAREGRSDRATARQEHVVGGERATRADRDRFFAARQQLEAMRGLAQQRGLEHPDQHHAAEQIDIAHAVTSMARAIASATRPRARSLASR